MYSILGRGSFCINYCLNSAWHGGDQFVALLRWYGSLGFFDNALASLPFLQTLGAVLSVGCAFFSSTLFPSTQLSVNMLGYSTL